MANKVTCFREYEDGSCTEFHSLLARFFEFNHLSKVKTINFAIILVGLVLLIRECVVRHRKRRLLARFWSFSADPERHVGGGDVKNSSGGPSDPVAFAVAKASMRRSPAPSSMLPASAAAYIHHAPDPFEDDDDDQAEEMWP